jgi:hypothetical protein
VADGRAVATRGVTKTVAGSWLLVTEVVRLESDYLSNQQQATQQPFFELR